MWSKVGFHHRYFLEKLTKMDGYGRLLLNSPSERFPWKHGVILVYNRYSEQTVYNLTKRRILPPLFSGEIFTNGRHNPSERFPRKHSWWNDFSVIATLNSQYVIWPKKDSSTKKFSKMDGFLHVLVLREMLIAFPWLKLNITFQKHFLPICNHWMEQARSCYSER